MMRLLVPLFVLLLSALPVHAQVIPLDTWIAIQNPTNLTGSGLTAALYEKHMTAAYSPKTKRLYFNGGDTRKHFVGPGGVDFGSSSYYQGTHSLDLNVRLASPGQPNAGTATEHAYCVSSPTEVQPKRPDFVGFTWASWLDKFVLIPGEFYNGSSANCPGETPSYADDLPNYPWRKIFTLDVTTKQWAVLSANHGAKYIGNDYPWHSYADPVTKRIIRLESNGDLVADHYDPATDTWAYFYTSGNQLNCAQSHLAVLDRTMYCVDREHGLFGAYQLDTHAAQASPLPGDPWNASMVSKDKGYVFAIPSARKIVYVEIIPATATFRVWMWSPDAPGWSRIDTLPWKTLDGEVLPAGESPRGTSGAVDTDLGILYLTGEYWGTANYSWALRLSGAPMPPQAPSQLILGMSGNGKGSVTGAGMYVQGTTVTLGAIPAPGSVFKGWNDPPCAATFQMPNTPMLACFATFVLATPTPPPCGTAGTLPCPCGGASQPPCPTPVPIVTIDIVVPACTGATPPCFKLNIKQVIKP